MIFERFKLERCGLHSSLANLKGFNFVTDFFMVGHTQPEIFDETFVKIYFSKIVFTSKKTSVNMPKFMS